MKPISRDFAWAVAILIPFATGIAVHKFIFGVVNTQEINMETAKENLPYADAMLRRNDRFKDVIAFVYTGQGGALGFSGSVEKEEVLFQLMKDVAAERFTITIHWNVKVSNEQEKQ